LEKLIYKKLINSLEQNSTLYEYQFRFRKNHSTVRAVMKVLDNIHCVPKNISDIFDCNVKKDYRILIIFGTNISETPCRQVTI